MIIKSYEANKSNLEGRSIILLYGKNEGLQNETVEKTFISGFKGSIDKYDENEFINTYEIIFSEILTKSLFDEKKLLIISRVGEKILKYIEEISDRNIEDIVIILKTGLLEKRSKLRIFFEKSKKLAIIPFYEDDTRTLSSLANEYLNIYKIKLSSESINLLVGRSSGSRENLKKELSKIFNYSHSNKEISFEVVKKLSNLAENFGVSELADNYLSKK